MVMIRARVPLLAAVAALCVVASFVEAGRGSGGTYSLPIGNPVISGTTITSTWANTTLQDLGTEITNSLDRNGRGAMTAPLKLTTGTAGAPALTFSSDVTSGLYLNGAGDVRVAASTSNAQRWTSTLSTLFTPLTVTGLTTTTTLRVTDSSDQLTVVPTNADVNALTATSRGNGTAGAFTATDTGRGVSVLASSGIGIFSQSTAGIGASIQGANVGVNTTATDAIGVGVFSEGGTAGYGLVATGGFMGVEATSTGGTGVSATSTSGTGVAGVSSSGTGISATSTSGTGLVAIGSVGVRATTQTAATATTRSVAIHATNGDLSFGGTVSPASGLGVSNTLTPANITKAWGAFSVDDINATVKSGFCVGSVDASINNGQEILVTLAPGCPMASENYAVILSNGGASVGGQCVAYVTSKLTGSFTIKLLYASLNGLIPCRKPAISQPTHVNWAGANVDFIVMGVQP